MTQLLPLIAGLVGLAAVLWFLLERHENRRAAAGLPRHGGIRLVIAAVALLVLLFSGGCSLLFLINQDGAYVTWEAVAVLGGIPFAVALAIWWIAMRRQQAAPPPQS